MSGYMEIHVGRGHPRFERKPDPPRDGGTPICNRHRQPGLIKEFERALVQHRQHRRNRAVDLQVQHSR